MPVREELHALPASGENTRNIWLLCKTQVIGPSAFWCQHLEKMFDLPKHLGPGRGVENC